MSELFHHKVTAVLGLGRSGRAAAKFLQQSGARVLAWDDVPAARETAAADGIVIEDLTTVDWSQIDELILSPGIPHHHPAPHPLVAHAKAAGITPISDIEILWRTRPEAQYVGITGTNGKSTTTSLIGHILTSGHKTCQVGGNIGVPVMDLPPLSRDETYVLEMSSYQLEITPSIHFNVAVILNISPDHLDRHGGLSGYIDAKKRIFSQSTPSDTLVIGIDDPHCLAVYEELRSSSQVNLIPISTQKTLDNGIYVEDGLLHDGHDIHNLRACTHLRGKHNWQNAAAAYATCKSLGLAPPQIMNGLTSFPGLQHRQQLVKTWENIRFINDSKATNAEAVAQALQAYKGTDIYWLVGGRPKEGGIDSLEGFFSTVHHAFVFGEAQEQFAMNLEGKVDYTRAKDLREATEFALKKAQKDNKKEPVIMLSPACSSFDQFKDFEVRGHAFCGYVDELTN